MFRTQKNPLSADLGAHDKQITKTDDPLPNKSHLLYGIIGRKGSGKSTLAISLLTKKSSPYYRHFANIYLVSPTCSRDPKFDKLREELQREAKFFDHLDEEVIDDILGRVNRFNEEYMAGKVDKKTGKLVKPTEQPYNLLILDDCLAALPSSHQRTSINRLWTNNRHSKLSIWVMSQKYNSLSTLIRSNMDLVSFFPTDSQREFDSLANDWSIDPVLLRKIYNFAISEPNSFLHMSFFARKPQFFKKFDRILMDDSDEKTSQDT